METGRKQLQENGKVQKDEDDEDLDTEDEKTFAKINSDSINEYNDYVR